MKALLGLASLFQVIPKLSWLGGQEAEAGRGGGGKTAPHPSLTVGSCFATSPAAADGSVKAHTLDAHRKLTDSSHLCRPG